MADEEYVFDEDSGAVARARKAIVIGVSSFGA